MLKKAGIIVAVAATGLIAVTSLAFADTTRDNVTNTCEVGATGAAIDNGQVGGDSLVAAAGAVTSLITPATNQLQTLNCTNAVTSDLFDSGSNNDDETHTTTKIEDSNNVED